MNAFTPLPLMDGIQQYAYTNGTDKPDFDVHFLHGNGFHACTLLPMASHFTAPFKALFTDLPGHGNSLQPTTLPPNWPSIARQVGKVLEARIERPIIGIGHSFGGTITLYMALAFPHLFRQIILLDPIMFPPLVVHYLCIIRHLGLWKRNKLVSTTANRRNRWQDKDQALAYFKSKKLYQNWQPNVLQLFVDYALKSNTQGQLELCCSPAWEAQLFGSYPKGLWRAVKQISLPTTILRAKHSFPQVPEAIELAAKRNPNIEVKQFGEAHCFPMEETKKTAQALEMLII